jgi:hypothetical protein
MDEIQPPHNPEIAATVVQGEQSRKSRQVEMGWIGRAFGSHTDKPGNIAAFVIIVSFLFLAAIFIFAPDSQDISKREIAASCFALISGALGFVFGRNTN